MYCSKNIIIASIFALCFCILPHVNAEDDHINFSDENINVVLKRASNEGKLVFLDFYANWCTPCKWMDKTTFRDPNVVKTIKNSFIPLKVNIDETQGFNAKNKYNVNYLPTILILDSNGKVIGRVEETLNAKDLVELLERHNKTENKKVIRHNFNVSPFNIDTTNDTKVDPFRISNEDYNRYINEKRISYKIQVGVFDNFEAAQKKVSKLRETFLDPIVVINDYRTDKVMFKVMLGQFGTVEEANSFVSLLKREFQINGIVY